jgi:transposase
VFTWIQQRVVEPGLLTGGPLGIDGTTLEANAALRSIVRRDTGETYNEFLTKLAQASGIATPTREDLAKVDKKRPKKGSNDDWQHPQDPDAAITKMKDGRTHLAHKAEHAVDLKCGAIVAVTVQRADAGDTQTIQDTLVAAAQQLEATVGLDPDAGLDVVADKGYHSNDVLTHLLQCRSVSVSLRRTCSRAVDVVARFSWVISTARDNRQHGRTTGGMAAPDAWKTLPTVPFGSVRIT